MPPERRIEKQKVSTFTQKKIHDELRQLLKEREEKSTQEPVTDHQKNLAKLADELTRSGPVTRLQERKQTELLQQVVKERDRFHPYRRQISQKELMDILRQEAARSVRGENTSQTTIEQQEVEQNVALPSTPPKVPQITIRPPTPEVPQIIIRPSTPEQRQADAHEQVTKLRMAKPDQGKSYTSDEVQQMQIEATKQVEELKPILHAKLKEISEQYPALRNIPPIDEIWRLGIGGKYHDKGPFCFENEPFYVPSTMRGFSTMLGGLGKKLNAESFEQLHDACMKDTVVLKTLIKKRYPSVLGYRKKDTQLRIKMREWSEDGYKELKRKYDCRKDGAERDPRYGNEGHPVGNVCYDDPYKMKDKYQHYRVRELAPDECREIATRIIDQYYKDIEQSRNDEEKLTAIGDCCQSLYQVQLFTDGNTRTCYLTLNKLLIENGFSLTNLRNLNVLKAHSNAEVKVEIRAGQEPLNALLTKPAA